jgi:RNA polymerase sigma-70 factor (ECF subfamily)
MKAIAETETSEQTLHTEFAKIYEQYFSMTCAAAYMVLGSREDAKDVAQNVFISLAERGFSPDKTRNLKAYLYGAATKHALCLVRWRGRRKLVDNDVEYPSDTRTDFESIPFQGPLMDAIAKLKPKAAKMVALRYAFDHTDEEIAEILGTHRVMVAMTLSRARKQLGKLIEQEARGQQ